MSMNRKILHIAVPGIVSNITVPLLSLADTTITGHLGAAVYLAAIALGGLMFNMVYWLFGFLRMGTGGLTAQACGAGNEVETYRLLFRSLAIAAVMAVLLIVLQCPIFNTAFLWLKADAGLRALASQYYHILIWGSPAMLGMYSFTGWFLGKQDARTPMIVAIVQNLINIAASCLFVFLLDGGLKGVAAGTLIAQYSGLLMVMGIFLYKHRKHIPVEARRGVIDGKAMLRFLQINRDIFLRTLCLIAVTAGFTAVGSAQGEGILAANTLLMQFFVLFSYLMDGFAYAGEALGGYYSGAGNICSFRLLVRRLMLWGTGVSIVFLFIYISLGSSFLHLLTNDFSVIATALPYLPYACLIPVVSMPAFIFDGIFIGTTSTRYMLVSMFMAFALFAFGVVFLPGLETYFLPVGVAASLSFSWAGHIPQGNHLLWLSFLTYLAARGLVQALLYPRVRERIKRVE